MKHVGSLSTPFVGDILATVGTAYNSGNNIPNVIEGDHIALYEVDASQKVVKFIDIILVNSNIGIQPLVSAGGGHNILMSSDGKVWIWGGNWWGQQGNGTLETATTPTQLTGFSGNVKSIAAGTSYTIVVKKDGTVWNWGYTTDPQPVKVEGLQDIKYAAAGGNPVGMHEGVVSENGEIWMWGDNGSGQLGDGTHIDKSAPIKIEGIPAMKGLALGFFHTIALAEDGLSNVRAISSGEQNSFAIKSDGTIWGWGVNSSGQLGVGTKFHETAPTLLPFTNMKQLFINKYMLVLTGDGNVLSSGSNYLGQLGDGFTVTPNQSLFNQLE